MIKLPLSVLLLPLPFNFPPSAVGSEQHRRAFLVDVLSEGRGVITNTDIESLLFFCSRGLKSGYGILFRFTVASATLLLVLSGGFGEAMAGEEQPHMFRNDPLCCRAFLSTC